MFVIQLYSKSSASILSAEQATALPHSTKSTIFAGYLLSFFGVIGHPPPLLSLTIYRRGGRVLLSIGFTIRHRLLQPLFIAYIHNRITPNYTLGGQLVLWYGQSDNLRFLCLHNKYCFLHWQPRPLHFPTLNHSRPVCPHGHNKRIQQLQQLP